MNRIIKIFTFLYLSFVLSFKLQAQLNTNYSVNINPVVYPNYPTSLAYLGVASKPTIRLTINHKSSNASIINALLRVVVKTKTFTAQTKSLEVAFPITLIGNTPISLNNLDIQSLYNFSNLSGVTDQQYNTAFPEGEISFGFIVYEATTRRQISQLTNYTYIFSLENPPLLTTPIKDSTISDIGSFPNVLFQWMPRQVSITGSVMYVFEMVQISPILQQSAALAFSTLPIIFSDSTYSTTYLYNARNPPILDENYYAWRVRAVSSDYGGFDNAIFRNRGYSNPERIYYSTPCILPVVTKIELDTTSVNISWDKTNSKRQSITFYKKLIKVDTLLRTSAALGAVKVKEVVVDANFSDEITSAGWTYVGTATGVDDGFHINNLQPNASYQIKYKSSCATPDGRLQVPVLVSNDISVRTKDPDSTLRVFVAAQAKINAICGNIKPTQLSTQALLTSLKANDIISGGDFKIMVNNGVTGSNGYFTGTGVLDIWIGKLFKANVKFTNVKLNAALELMEGAITIINQ